jgi:Zn-finger nucleic acid-binding protein
MLGAAAAAAALVALGRSSAKRSESWHNNNKAQHKERLQKIKKKYSKRFNDEEVEILKNIKKKISDKNSKISCIKCPECGNEFRLIYINEIELDVCVRCVSFWFDNGELKKFSGLASDIPSRELTSRKSKYKCPICKVDMVEHVFTKPHNLLVDHCKEHGVYLENKELDRVIEIS